ncbi:MAG: hypothetical protein U7M05_02600 [Candidatus Igneacidithiobacillus chanchocoensis]
MNTSITVMNVRKFIEVAADAYVRGENYRPYPPVMKEVATWGAIKFVEPPADYLCQLWGPSFSQDEATIYRQLIDQLVNALKSGALPSRRPPLMVPNPVGDVNLESDVIYLHEFKAWLEKNELRALRNWYALVMAATEPGAEPVRIEGTEQSVQFLEKRGRPTNNAKQQAYNYYRDRQRQIEIARDLQQRGEKITPENMIAELMRLSSERFPGSDTSKETWATSKNFTITPIYKALGIRQERRSKRLKKS